MAKNKKAAGAKPAKASKTDKLRATREAAATAPAPDAKAGKKRGKRQAEIPGFERTVDGDLDQLAASASASGDALSQARTDHTAAIAAMSEAMHRKNVIRYQYVDGTTTRDFVFSASKLRVVKVKADKAAAEDDDE